MQQAIFNHLQTMMQQVDDCLQHAVDQVAAHGYDATDALRGLVVRADEAQGLVDANPLQGLWQMENPPTVFIGDDPTIPFVKIVQAFDLTTVDAIILLMVFAPELDQRYQRIYGYLQDDVTLRYPTINLMMHLLASDGDQRFEVYQRLQPEQPLIKYNLIQIDSPENRPNSLLIHRHLRVDSGVTAFILGEETVDKRLENVLQANTPTPNLHLPEATLRPIFDALPQNPFVYLLGETPLEHLETAYALCAEHNQPMLHLQADRLPTGDTKLLIWLIALRETMMRHAVLFISSWESLLQEDGTLPIVFWNSLLDFGNAVFISGREKWEPATHDRQRLMLRLEFEAPNYDARYRTWQQLLQDQALDPDMYRELAVKFRFHRQQIVQAVQTAHDLAASSGRDLQFEDLQSAARAHTRLRLGRFADQIETKVSWDKLILPPEPLTQLQEMVSRVRFAHRVQDDWGYGGHISNAQGISALFAGESGTGKTLSAQIIATELGLPLYKIDLSGIVDKYIGETEKNLRVIFEEAKSNSAILFFDEADAIFGKRSEVKDARDRYANIEVAYLLQQIESYDGIAILATNLRQNLDDAFTRRLDFLINFPFPEAQYREKIWKAHFPEKAPLASNVDIMEIAERYELSGGNIRNITLTAAYLAAVDSDVIAEEHIRSAIRREHQKLGRLLD